MDGSVVITGAGILSALGDSPAEFHRNLCEGKLGLKLMGSEFGARTGGMISDLDERKYLGYRSARALNRISRLATAAADLALRDAGWTREMRNQEEVSLVLGTMFCGVHTIGEFDRRALAEGPGYASPMDFANTVINAAAGQTAIWHNLRGINSTVATGTGSGLHAIAYAAELIRSGQTRAVLAGGADELCMESFYGLARSGLLCPAGDAQDAFPIPFDVRRNGFAPAEAAAFLMLEEEESAVRRGATILGRITCGGSGFDPSLGRSHEDSMRAIAYAITSAIDDAGLEPEEIDCISASANGSTTGDRNEAFGIAMALNGRAAHLPVAAVKAGLGEAMGASGPAQVIALIQAAKTGILPGIPGLLETDRDLPLKQIAFGSRPLELRTALVNSVSLDGNCCALIFEAGHRRVPAREGQPRQVFENALDN